MSSKESRHFMKSVQIVHRTSGEVLADGPLGWGITPFEGNFYISRKYLKTDRSHRFLLQCRLTFSLD